MSSNDKSISIEDEHRELYLAQAKEQPPQYIDDEIMAMARQQVISIANDNDHQHQHKVSRIGEARHGVKWQRVGWSLSSAASVLLVVGVLIFNQQWYPTSDVVMIPDSVLQDEIQDMALAGEDDIKQFESEELMRSEIVQIQAKKRAAFAANDAVKNLAQGTVKGSFKKSTPQTGASAMQPLLARSQMNAELMSAGSLSFDNAKEAKKEPGIEAPLAKLSGATKPLQSRSIMQQSDGFAEQLRRDNPEFSKLVDMLDKALLNKKFSEAKIINQHILNQYSELADVSQVEREKLIDLRTILDQIKP